MQWCIVLVLLSTIFANECWGRDLPSYFPRCHIDDENLNDCILKAANELRPQIRKGIEQIKLPAFDPLVISSITLKQGESNFTYINITVNGLDDYDFEEIKYDPKTLIFSGKVKFKDIFYTAHYSASARVLYFPVVGSGLVETAMGSVNGTFEVRGELVTRKSEKYYKPTSVKVRISVKDASGKVHGLFDGNPELGRTINDLGNLNIRTLTEIATPAFEETTEKFLMVFMRTLTRLVPYTKIFPHS